jgi:hypothetical protein
MAAKPNTEEELQQAVEAFKAHPTKKAAADSLRLNVNTFKSRLDAASRKGMLGYSPVMEGFEIVKVSTNPNGDHYIQQKKERGGVFELPEGHIAKGYSTLTDADGRIIQQWTKTTMADIERDIVIKAVVDALKDELPREKPVIRDVTGHDKLLSMYAVTDLHMGALAWHEETGNDDYDLGIAEELIRDWFAAAIALSPNSKYAMLAQMGDLLHWDGFDSVTPTSKHVLDGDSRFPKMVRAAIRVMRHVVRSLLEKHDEVIVVMADANHDPASGVWLREMFAVLYEDEPRVHVETTSQTYYAYKHGDVSLFIHHGHRRKINDVDSVFAGKYRDIYGSTKYSYAHLGHLHSDELKSTNLMKVERHETLAAPDSYASNGGWLSNRSAKVITYHKEFGEVGRLTLTPAMVAGKSGREKEEV